MITKDYEELHEYAKNHNNLYRQCYNKSAHEGFTREEQLVLTISALIEQQDINEEAIKKLVSFQPPPPFIMCDSCPKKDTVLKGIKEKSNET